jgi:L-iditol 2-dehydrogenase
VNEDGQFRQWHLLGPRMTALESLPLPQPGAGEVTLDVDAALTCGTDLKVWRRGGHPRMLMPPCAFGHEVCGTIRAVGDQVSGWKVGERVVLSNSSPCGACSPCRRGRDNLCTTLRYWNGAFADVALVPAPFVATSLRRVPAGLAPEIAALTEPLACVHHGLSALRAQPGERVGVLGCGPIGLLFVGELAAAGVDVVALDPNPSRLEVAAGLGATRTEVIRDREHPRCSVRLDALAEATGSPSAWSAASDMVDAGGRVLYFGGVPPGQRLEIDAVRFHYQELALLGAYHYTRAAFDASLASLARSGERWRPLLSEDRPLEDLLHALAAMEQRQILKAVLRPHGPA